MFGFATLINQKSLNQRHMFPKYRKELSSCFHIVWWRVDLCAMLVSHDLWDSIEGYLQCACWVCWSAVWVQHDKLLWGPRSWLAWDERICAHAFMGQKFCSQVEQESVRWFTSQIGPDSVFLASLKNGSLSLGSWLQVACYFWIWCHVRGNALCYRAWKGTVGTGELPVAEAEVPHQKEYR